MKKKHLKTLLLNKASVSSLQSNYGGRTYTTHTTDLPDKDTGTGNDPSPQSLLTGTCPTDYITLRGCN
ncbi:hypothetical protein [Ascidiimonas aurantiaca]|uniref:hypothetical protein n=1 Tax=Ascidiimonas aurantiaca TaxID=1685432 RepID=UPI0030EB6952